MTALQQTWFLQNQVAAGDWEPHELFVLRLSYICALVHSRCLPYLFLLRSLPVSNKSLSKLSLIEMPLIHTFSPINLPITAAVIICLSASNTQSPVYIGWTLRWYWGRPKLTVLGIWLERPNWYSSSVSIFRGWLIHLCIGNEPKII